MEATRLSAEERRVRRQQKRTDASKKPTSSSLTTEDDDGRVASLLSKNEDALLEFVAKVNKVYQDILKQPAPFMTFVLVGMQSAGKSTINERFMNKPLNIVQEGTGTRCPLDTTCIHDASCGEPICELSGNELLSEHVGSRLTANQVFERITAHNRALGAEDRFSTEPLRLVYRSKQVQNMRFVDTPGIISNKSTGRDNREEIKRILQSELLKPNTKLCVLLEPKEFATNPIVDFCDETFGGRDNWKDKATFLMTKFDKQLEDSRTGGKANKFFEEYFNNGIYPHLVITPTLEKEDLPAEQLFEKRAELLAKADEGEMQRFGAWRQGHRLFCQENGDSEEDLHREIQKQISFQTVMRVMKQTMLEDTVKTLPEVLAALRRDLGQRLREERTLLERQKFSDPKKLKGVAMDVLVSLEKKILSYLDGDLESTIKFPDAPQTLHQEVDGEEESDWVQRELNFHSEKEESWRDRICKFEGEYPPEVQSDSRFLGGKQYQRAVEFFGAVMVDSLPDPYELKDKVSNATGYLAGGLQRENWERATVQIVKVCVKDLSHPGINYLIKHVGFIFRRLFHVAMDDIKQGEEFSAVFRLLPTVVERYMMNAFDDVLWKVMTTSAEKSHCSLEPMYSTVDPNLPFFHAAEWDRNLDTEQGYHYVKEGEADKPLPSKEEGENVSYAAPFTRIIKAIMSGSGSLAKQYLKEEQTSRANIKKRFLSDERTSMITDSETDRIIQRSLEYIVALMEFNLVNLKFQLNHYLYEGFKNALKTSFSRTLANAEWETLVQPDPDVAVRLAQLRQEIDGLRDSLLEVQRIERHI